MSDDLKKMYRTVMDDHFPSQITISFGDQVLAYKKRAWKIPDDKSGELIEKGLRYGENPGQEAALYELVNGNLVLGECQFIEPGNGLVSAITEEDMIQSGKHPGKINLTDIDNALNIMKYLSEGPVAVIVKHNNPCGVAYGASLSEAYDKANMAELLLLGVVPFSIGRWTLQRLNPSQRTTWKWWLRLSSRRGPSLSSPKGQTSESYV